MSYSAWADFVYYNAGDIATYNTIAYQALQANINVIPTSLAPNWQVLPSGGGTGVSSLVGGTGALTMYSPDATFTLNGNQIDMAITFPPPIVQYPSFISDAIPDQTIELNTTTYNAFKTVNLSYVWLIDKKQGQVEVFFNTLAENLSNNDVIIYFYFDVSLAGGGFLGNSIGKPNSCAYTIPAITTIGLSPNLISTTFLLDVDSASLNIELYVYCNTDNTNFQFISSDIGVKLSPVESI